MLIYAFTVKSFSVIFDIDKLSIEIKSISFLIGVLTPLSGFFFVIFISESQEIRNISASRFIIILFSL